MPNRMIRDDLLDSERVIGLPVEARWLFVTVMLSADDLGLFEATEFRLARRADVRREHASKLLQLLADADLVRLYQHEGKRYGFVPRFRQKLQIKRSKRPLPPLALLAGDEDALEKVRAFEAAQAGGLAGAFGKQWDELREQVFERDGYRCIRCQSQDKPTAHHLVPKSKGGEHALDNLVTLCASCNAWARNNDARCNEIKHLASKADTGQHLRSIDAASIHPPEAEAEAEAEAEKREEKPPAAPTEPPGVVAKAPYRPPPCPSPELVALYHQHLPELPAVEVLNEARKRALGARWREVCTEGKLDRAQGLEWFAWYFARVARSRFLTGRMPPRPGGRDWRASFDFLVRPMSFAKVVEGAYA